MRIDISADYRNVDDAVAGARRARDAGVRTMWIPQIEGLAPMIVLGIVAREVPDIGLGIGVAALPTTHPTLLAQEAITLSQISDGRFTLGIGLSHRPVVEQNWGLPWHPPIRYMNEYLDVLLPLLEERRASTRGTLVSAQWWIEAEAPPVAVILAALGPQMLRLAGRRAAGTLTWMVGVRTLAEHTVPTIREAAGAAGRPEPVVTATYPVCVTTEVDAARERAAKVYKLYGVLPSYRAMLEREGASGPEDLAVIGEAGFVRERLAEIEAAGATTVGIDLFGRRAEREATWELIAELAS